MESSHEAQANESDSQDGEDREHSYREAKTRLEWIHSAERRNELRFRNATYVVILVVFVVISAIADKSLHESFFSLDWSINSKQLPYFLPAIGIAAVGGSLTGLNSSQQRSVFESRRLVEEYNQLQASEDQVVRAGELDLVVLWRVNQQRLDYYHEIITQQARQSFRNAQVAMVAGLLVLVVSVAVVFAAKTTAATITVGLLGGIGTTLSGYIGRTFIRSQENAAGNLRDYFTQPLEFSRYLTAERLAWNIPDGERSPVFAQLASKVVDQSQDAVGHRNQTEASNHSARNRPDPRTPKARP